jgi:cytochrome c peroxidase
MSKHSLVFLFLTIVLIPALCGTASALHETPITEDTHVWSEAELQTIRSLWLGSLPPLPKDPSNAYSDNPRAAELGKKFFFDKRFSANGTVSCGTCHQPDRNFEDGLPLSHGIGMTTRRTMPLIGMAYQSWFFWDGRRDSLWAQALSPPEAPLEHGITRTLCALIISQYYRDEYEEVFGPLPDFNEKDYPILARPAPDFPYAYDAWQSMSPEMRDNVNRVYVNMGKAIAAYVRLILPEPSTFDRYAEAAIKGDKGAMMEIFTPTEAEGLRLFIGKAKCTNCHNGPMFTNGDFHNTGIPQPSNLMDDRGRADGIRKVHSDLFNCLGKYSDAEPKQCLELRFMDTHTERYVGFFKTPTLRNVADRPPYMHAGQFKTLREVLEHYRTVKPGGMISPELEHRGLSDMELDQLEAFLRTLTGPLKAP